MKMRIEVEGAVTDREGTRRIEADVEIDYDPDPDVCCDRIGVALFEQFGDVWIAAALTEQLRVS